MVSVMKALVFVMQKNDIHLAVHRSMKLLNSITM
jgi:hypothetical protein